MSNLIRKMLLCFLLCLLIWLGGLLWFIFQIPSHPSDNSGRTDAIVVLTGGSGRLDYGLLLLIEGKSDSLFISGVSQNITLEQLLQQSAMPDIKKRVSIL